MSIALISDIHANLEALEAVLEDIDQHGCDTVFCLGDLVDYGPNPREVLDIAMERFQLNILGNHEEAVMLVAEDFNERAMRSVHWTRDQLNAASVPREKRHQYWNFLDGLTRQKFASKEDRLFVHGSPRQVTRDYIFPKDIKSPEKMRQIFTALKAHARYCFCGHSHIPGIYTEDCRYGHPSKIKDGRVNLRQFEALLINIGSVGQPRDNDTRASYAILDGDEVIFRRVEYDVHKTVEKLRAIPTLPAFLGERLLQGK